MDRELLLLKPMAELRYIAKAKGFTISNKDKKVDLVEKIILIPDREEPEKKETPKEPEPTYTATQEDILKAIDGNIRNGLRIKFLDDGWMIRGNGKEDSGSYTMPLHTIKRCANNLVKSND